MGAQDLSQLKPMRGSTDTNTSKISDELGMLLEDLTALSTAERAVFVSFVFILFVLSMCGNIGTLHVNFRRKIRPFFRACLISLAFSDLINTFFMSTAYMAEFTAHYVQVWRIGDTMCSLVPFITTAAILASSVTLVGIAVDRYFAVMRSTIGCWNPGFVFCVVCMLIIWVASLFIAAPVYFVYDIYSVSVLAVENNITTILTTPIADQTHTTTEKKQFAFEAGDSSTSSEEAGSFILVEKLDVITMCISNQRAVAPYYLVVFGIIFVPCIVAFIWLNCIIAKKIWNRRQVPSPKKMCGPATKTPASDLSYKANNPNCSHCNQNPNSGKSSLMLSLQLLQTNNFDIEVEQITQESQATQPRCCQSDDCLTSKATKQTTFAKEHNPHEPGYRGSSARESRHIRMFTIIILMVAVFLFFRLPAWIFLILRMYSSHSNATDWILYFSFGVLNLASCVLNPLFYTFLTETIQYAMLIKVKVFDNVCGLRLCWDSHQQRRNPLTKPDAFMDGNSNGKDNAKPKGVRAHCCCCWHFTTVTQNQPQRKIQMNELGSSLPETIFLDKDPKQLNNDKDEGVECSDGSDVEENICDHQFDEFRHNIGGNSRQQNHVFTIYTSDYA